MIAQVLLEGLEAWGLSFGTRPSGNSGGEGNGGYLVDEAGQPDPQTVMHFIKAPTVNLKTIPPD